MKRRVLTLVLALITVLGMFAACAAPEEQEQSSDNSSEAVTGDVYEQALAKLTVDMKGDDFVVLGRGDAGSSVYEIMREEASSDPLENAVYNRNRALSEICKLNYIAKLTPSDALSDTLSNDIKAARESMPLLSRICAWQALWQPRACSRISTI